MFQRGPSTHFNGSLVSTQISMKRHLNCLLVHSDGIKLKYGSRGYVRMAKQVTYILLGYKIGSLGASFLINAFY